MRSANVANRVQGWQSAEDLHVRAGNIATTFRPAQHSPSQLSISDTTSKASHLSSHHTYPSFQLSSEPKTIDTGLDNHNASEENPGPASAPTRTARGLCFEYLPGVDIGRQRERGDQCSDVWRKLILSPVLFVSGRSQPIEHSC